MEKILSIGGSIITIIVVTYAIKSILQILF